MQQEKLKEVKSRLNFEGCSRRNSKVQEVSQHSESRTPKENEEGTEEYSIGWEIEDIVCPHTQIAVTRVIARKERNSFPKNVTIREHIPGGQKFSPKVKTAEGDTGSQDQKSKGQASRMMIYHNHGFKAESRHVKGAPKCMRTSGFVHVITNPELIKRLHGNIPKSVDDMMRVTTAFLKGKVAASNQARKKAPPVWKQQEAKRKQIFDRIRDFKTQHRSEQRRDKFTFLTKSSKEILALDKCKFKTSQPMTTPIEKRKNNKFCEFYGEVGHNTDECMHLKRQIKEMIKAGKLTHLIKELNKEAKISQKRQKGRKVLKRKGYGNPDGPTVGESSQVKDYTEFLPRSRNFVPTLRDEDGTGGPMIIEAEIRGHLIHRMGCETLSFNMDELRGSKVTISVQWNYRKARCEENSSSPINGSWNDEILGPMRSTYSMEQQDNPTGMHDGLRTETRLISTLSVKPTIPKVSKRRTKAEGKASNPKQIPLKINRKVTAFLQNIEKLIAKLPTLTAPIEKKELIVYLAAMREVVIPVLITKREAKQTPVYFVSRALQGPEINYTSMETLVLALGHAIKGQILANFIVKRPEDDSSDTPIEAEEELSDPWTLFTDGSSCMDGSRAGLILTDPEGAERNIPRKKGKDKSYTAQIKTVRCSQWVPIQIIISQTMVTMRGATTSKYVLREIHEVSCIHACRNKICGSKCNTDMILLAYDARECKKTNPRMSGLPVILAEIGMPTFRMVEIDMVHNDEALEINLELLEETKEQAAIREARSKAKMQKYYNSKVRNTSFRPRDLVYRNNDATHAKDNGKLSLKWEGPYEVTEALGNRAYKLRDRNVKHLS
nr:reverse transcriptase domain-containing protein [Tanacetum cinerariifolium]